MKTIKNLNDASQLTEDGARKYLEQIRWKGGVRCAHCGHDVAYTIKSKNHKPGMYKCANCRKLFSVTTDTIMHGSHISLRQWVMAFYIMASSKKSVSALQMQRQLGLGSYRTAWHLCHRIRESMRCEPLRKFLAGDVEVDETYVGGKPRFKGPHNNPFRGHGTKKTPVMALVERDGKMVCKPIERVNGKTLKGAIREHVKGNSRIITDENNCYKGIGAEFIRGHVFVTHSAKEYVRGDVYTNTAESYFALLKRGMMGSFHHVSKHHLHRYCNEFMFRWNRRKDEDYERAEDAIRDSDGKRLMYKEPAKRS